MFSSPILLTFCRLRRAVLHPNLVLSNVEYLSPPTDAEEVDIQTLIGRFSAGEDETGNGNVFAEGVLHSLDAQDEAGECPICLDVMDTPMIIPVCMHQWFVS